jgi:hypothetical protein
MLAVSTVLKELDVSENLYYKCDTAGFAQELAVGISNNGALIKLDISNNYIGAEQKGSLQRICVASGIDLDV